MKITRTSPQSPRLLLTETALCAWVGQAGIGDALVYHCGSLARDRSPVTSPLPPRDRAELGRVAHRAPALAEAGLTDLALRRFGADTYEYRIIIRPRPPRGRGALLRVLAPEL
jgi:hypothetical protein